MHCSRRSDRAGNHAAHRQPGAVSEYGGLRHARARTAWRDHSLRVGQTPLEPKARIAVDRYGIPPSATVGFFDAPSGVHGTFFESVCAPQQIAPTDFRFGSWACLNVLTYEPELGESATQAGFLTLTMPGSQPSAAGCP